MFDINFKRLLLTVAFTATTLALFQHYSVKKFQAEDPEKYFEIIDTDRNYGEIVATERERDNRFIIHNMALLYDLKPGERENITEVFVGTSRTKALKPRFFGRERSINLASNSYNEITYGMLLDLEIAKTFLPNLERVYFESSMLLRRPPPPRFIVEKDHIKYLPLLAPLISERETLPEGEGFEQFVYSHRDGPQSIAAGFWGQRKKFRFTYEADRRNISIAETSVFRSLDRYGQYSSKLNYKTDQHHQMVAEDNIKVQRLRDIRSYAPFDYLFEMAARWGKRNQVDIVFFEPAVRNDLLAFQEKYGLKTHNEMMSSVANRYGVNFVNFNYPDNEISKHFELFSDEDHMVTCIGNAYIFSGLSFAEKFSKGSHKIEYSDIEPYWKSYVSKYCDN